MVGPFREHRDTRDDLHVSCILVSMAGIAEVVDAEPLSKAQLLSRIESVTLDFLKAVDRGEDPELHLVHWYCCEKIVSCVL